MPHVPRIWTIGHSTRTIDVFISLLDEHGIRLLADVRSLPGSKRYPQFNKEALSNSLGKSGINYEHFPELGGRRKAKPKSKNTAWRNASFRGYADYMETDDFYKGIKRFLDLVRHGTNPSDRRTAEAGPTAIMCANDLLACGALMALPPRAHCRLSESAGHGGQTHHGCEQKRAASIHSCSANCEWSVELRGRIVSLELFISVERFFAVANVSGSGETWRRSRKLPCRTSAADQPSNCQ